MIEILIWKRVVWCSFVCIFLHFPSLFLYAEVQLLPRWHQSMKSIKSQAIARNTKWSTWVEWCQTMAQRMVYKTLLLKCNRTVNHIIKLRVDCKTLRISNMRSTLFSLSFSLSVYWKRIHIFTAQRKKAERSFFFSFLNQQISVFLLLPLCCVSIFKS